MSTLTGEIDKRTDDKFVIENKKIFFEACHVRFILWETIKIMFI
jgi:hypothetical protein